MTEKKVVDDNIVDALEIVLERADWVKDRLDRYFDEEYDVDEVVNDWVEEGAEQCIHEWLDDKYDEFGPDGATFAQIIQDACAKAVKQHMTEQIMLMLLDEVRANMGRLLGRALHDYMNEVNTQRKEAK